MNKNGGNTYDAAEEELVASVDMSHRRSSMSRKKSTSLAIIPIIEEGNNCDYSYLSPIMPKCFSFSFLRDNNKAILTYDIVPSSTHSLNTVCMRHGEAGEEGGAHTYVPSSQVLSDV